MVLYKVNGCPTLTGYTNFCQQNGLSWYRPRSASDNTMLLTNAYNQDSYHTWINGKQGLMTL